MARVLVAGGAEFDALAFGAPHESTLSFIQTHLHESTRALTDAGMNWFQGIRNVYQHVDMSEAYRAARAVVRHVAHLWDDNCIHVMSDIGAMQNAKSVMQRWLMAEPTVRNLYHSQQCDGYSDSYVDIHGKVVGEDHYDYRRVMHGVVVEDDDGDWKATSYLEDLLPEDHELHLDEQMDILDSWEHLKAKIRAKKEDPTSRWNADL